MPRRVVTRIDLAWTIVLGGNKVLLAAEAQLKIVRGAHPIICRYSHKSLNVITKQSKVVPLIDPVIVNLASFIIIVGFDDIERPRGTSDVFDPKGKFNGNVSLSPM